MLNSKNVPKIDGLRIDEAHKGGGLSMLDPSKIVGSVIGKITGAPEMQTGMSATEQSAAKAQAEELAKLKKKEQAKIAAMKRGRLGRASLLAGAETGMKTTLGS